MSKMWPLLILLSPVLFVQPAQAAVGEDPATFERFLYKVPHSKWRKLPDAESGGLLYAGRVGSFDTLVHVFLKDGRITSERVEVAMPTDRNDELALAIQTRFLSEFVHHPRELQSVMNLMRGMRRTILGSGQQTAKLPYRKAMFSLALSSSPSEFSAKTIEVPWGMLYWTAEATPSKSIP